MASCGQTQFALCCTMTCQWLQCALKCQARNAGTLACEVPSLALPSYSLRIHKWHVLPYSTHTDWKPTGWRGASRLWPDTEGRQLDMLGPMCEVPSVLHDDFQPLHLRAT